MDEVEREVDQEIVALEDEIADTYNQVDVVLEGSTTSIQNSTGGIKNLVETTQDDITHNNITRNDVDDLTNNVADHIDDVVDTNTNKINDIIDNNINDATENATDDIGDLVDSAKLNGHVVQKKLGEAIEESLNKINDGIPSFNG